MGVGPGADLGGGGGGHDVGLVWVWYGEELLPQGLGV
jgi:hypothetical protein